MKKIFIIDDDAALCRSIELQLQAQGYDVDSAQTGREGVEAVGKAPPDLLFLDLTLPDRDGLEVLSELQKDPHACPVVVITARQEMKPTIEAMQRGAFDYIRKPFDIEELVLAVRKAERLQARPARGEPAAAEPRAGSRHEIVGSDPQILELLKQIGRLAKSRVSVLIRGESGTGKELVARAVHDATAPGEPFVAVNCSAVVRTLLESELFGHEKGAFTGAERRKTGKLELAGEGTVFFDEIGDMDVDLQAKLLRVLQEREFERVGGTQTIPFRARALFATHRDLKTMVREGQFRGDLFFRVVVAEIRIPPLRERRGDIRMLVHHFVPRLGAQLHKRIETVDEDALRRLETYDWPGNVRELENVLTRAVALAQTSVLLPQDIEFPFSAPQRGDLTPEGVRPLSEIEKDHIDRALRATGWNITRTASLLEISPTTLRKKIGDYGLKKP